MCVPAICWFSSALPPLSMAGVVDFQGVVAALEGVGYGSWLVVEQDASPDPYATSKASFQHLGSILDGTGI